LVVAAAGVPVAKHGNRSVSSRCGSADVLTALGVNIEIPFAQIEECIAEIGIGFLFAPRHHPAFKAVADIRRELGGRTIFNLLGPLANPARARHQVMGVYDSAWVPIIGGVLSALGSAHAFVVHGDGLDEITVTGSTRVCEVRDGSIREYSLEPEQLGLRRYKVEDILGGDASLNSQIVRDVLDGQKGAHRDAVVANAAAALVCGGVADELVTGVKRAEEAIDSGKARQKLEQLIEATRSPGA
jgi:anthranilate phosphoribosyltransferase